MATETDFFDLYRKLGLNPDCDMGQFKQAYRRRVKLLHPDLRGNSGVDARAAERLQRLTAQYNAALEFHRRHARLPGAPATRIAAAPAPVRSVVREHKTPMAGTSPAPRSRLTWSLVAAAASILLWNLLPLSRSAENTPAMAGQDDELAEESGNALTVGMSAENVRALEGEPTRIQGDRWEYGPSWIRFENDSVADWRSLPAFPLRHAEARPPATAAQP